jgi:hypothetical protein
MREWSAMLEQELGGWPEVTSRPMFGMVGFYRRGRIFAALPRTRALNTPHSVIFRFEPMPPRLARRAQRDLRVDAERKTPGAKWYSFELNSTEELREALWWMNQAYEAAKRSK